VENTLLRQLVPQSPQMKKWSSNVDQVSDAFTVKITLLTKEVFIMVTNFVLSVRMEPSFVDIEDLVSLQLGGPLAVSVFLITISAAGENHLTTVWRVCFGVGILLPLTVFYFRVRMLTSSLYQQNSIQRMAQFLADLMNMLMYKQTTFLTASLLNGTGNR